MATVDTDDPLATGLVFVLALDEGTGATVHDTLTGTAYTLPGTPSWGTLNGRPTLVGGFAATAFEAAALAGIAVSAEFTFVFRAALGSFGAVDVNGGGTGIGILVDGWDADRRSVSLVRRWGGLVGGTGIVVPRVRADFAVRVAGGQYRLFRNGAALGSAVSLNSAFEAPGITGTVLQFGANTLADLGHVYVWSRGLSDAEVAMLAADPDAFLVVQGSTVIDVGMAGAGPRGRTASVVATRATVIDVGMAGAGPAGRPVSVVVKGPARVLDLLETAGAGGWVNIATGRYDAAWPAADQMPLDQIGGQLRGSPVQIMNAWSSLAFDHHRQRLWLFGGGHANSYLNETYEFDLYDGTWHRTSLSTDVAYGPGGLVTKDAPYGSPLSAHTYNSNQYLPNARLFVSFGGAGAGGAAWNLSTAAVSNTTPTGPFTFDWSTADPNKAAGVASGGQAATAPGTQSWRNRQTLERTNLTSVIMVMNTAVALVEAGVDTVYLDTDWMGLQRFRFPARDDPTQDSRTRIGGFNVPGADAYGGDGAAGYDPVRRLHVRMGGPVGSPNFTYFDVASFTGAPLPSKQITGITDLTGGDLATMDCSNSGMTFDPVRRRFVIWSVTTNRVYALTAPATLAQTGWTFARLDAGGPAPTWEAEEGTGILGKWHYVPALDAFVGTRETRGARVWMWRPERDWAPAP